MGARFTQSFGDKLTFDFWLAFAQDGGLRLSRGRPALQRNERGMKMSVAVPKALFRTPELSANIEIADPGEPMPQIDVEAAQAALTEALGCDVYVTVHDPE